MGVRSGYVEKSAVVHETPWVIVHPGWSDVEAPFPVGMVMEVKRDGFLGVVTGYRFISLERAKERAKSASRENVKELQREKEASYRRFKAAQDEHLKAYGELLL